MNAKVKKDPSRPTRCHVRAGEAHRVDGRLEWRTIPGAYVTLRFAAQCIYLTPTADGVALARELVAARKYHTHPMLDDFVGNGWEWIPAESIGALTGCEDILSQDLTLNDAGEWEPATSKANVFWHESYAVEIPVEEWAAGRTVKFMRAEVTRKE